jgi:hypothetical protein
MILNRRLNPATALRLGMASLIAALMWPRLVHPTASFGPDLLDAAQGMLFGVGIGMNLLSVLLNRGRRCGDGR